MNSQQHKDIIIMHLNGYSFTEIAKAMKCNKRTVRDRVVAHWYNKGYTYYAGTKTKFKNVKYKYYRNKAYLM